MPPAIAEFPAPKAWWSFPIIRQAPPKMAWRALSIAPPKASNDMSYPSDMLLLKSLKPLFLTSTNLAFSIFVAHAVFALNSLWKEVGTSLPPLRSLVWKSGYVRVIVPLEPPPALPNASLEVPHFAFKLVWAGAARSVAWNRRFWGPGPPGDHRVSSAHVVRLSGGGRATTGGISGVGTGGTGFGGTRVARRLGRAWGAGVARTRWSRGCREVWPRVTRRHRRTRGLGVARWIGVGTKLVWRRAAGFRVGRGQVVTRNKVSVVWLGDYVRGGLFVKAKERARRPRDR